MDERLEAPVNAPALDATEPEDDLGDAAKGNGDGFIDQESDF